MADMVPVDMCINLMCVLGWKAATQPPSSPPPVYNCTSGATNPITWGELEKLTVPIIYDYPFETMFWHPGGSSKENWYIHRFCQVLYTNARIPYKSLYFGSLYSIPRHKNAGHNKAIHGQPCNVNTHANIPALFLTMLCLWLYVHMY